jgi:hypothetical protein
VSSSCGESAAVVFIAFVVVRVGKRRMALKFLGPKQWRRDYLHSDGQVWVEGIFLVGYVILGLHHTKLARCAHSLRPTCELAARTRVASRLLICCAPLTGSL